MEAHEPDSPESGAKLLKDELSDFGAVLSVQRSLSNLRAVSGFVLDKDEDSDVELPDVKCAVGADDHSDLSLEEMEKLVVALREVSGDALPEDYQRILAWGKKAADTLLLYKALANLYRVAAGDEFEPQEFAEKAKDLKQLLLPKQASEAFSQDGGVIRQVVDKLGPESRQMVGRALRLSNVLDKGVQTQLPNRDPDPSISRDNSKRSHEPVSNEMAQQLKRAREESDRLRNENSSFKATMNILNDSFKREESAKLRYEAKYDKERSRNNDLDDSCRLLERDLAKLKDRVESYRRQLSDCQGKLDVAKDNNWNLQDQCSRLRGERDSARRQLDAFKVTKEAIAEQSNAQGQIWKQYYEQSKKVADELFSKVKRKEAENEQLAARIKKLTCDLADWTLKTRSREKSLLAVESDLKKLTTALQDLWEVFPLRSNPDSNPKPPGSVAEFVEALAAFADLMLRHLGSKEGVARARRESLAKARELLCEREANTGQASGSGTSLARLLGRSSATDGWSLKQRSAQQSDTAPSNSAFVPRPGVPDRSVELDKKPGSALSVNLNISGRVPPLAGPKAPQADRHAIGHGLDEAHNGPHTKRKADTNSRSSACAVDSSSPPAISVASATASGAAGSTVSGAPLSAAVRDAGPAAPPGKTNAPDKIGEARLLRNSLRRFGGPEVLPVSPKNWGASARSQSASNYAQRQTFR